jgi:hypothetical protein
LPTTEEELIGPDDLLLAPAFSLPERQPELPAVEEPSGPDEQSGFDRKHREPFTGLLFLGKLSDTVTILGHSFLLETPDQNTRLESGILHKRYLNSISSEIGWAAIVVASYLKAVDGTPLPEPIGPEDTGLNSRFNWVVKNLFGEVIQRVYEKCLLLDARVSELMLELERLGES